MKILGGLIYDNKRMQDKISAFGEINFTGTANVCANKILTIKKIIVFAKDDIKIELKKGFDK